LFLSGSRFYFPAFELDYLIKSRSDLSFLSLKINGEQFTFFFPFLGWNYRHCMIIDDISSEVM
jgi:hypothetical protein